MMRVTFNQLRLFRTVAHLSGFSRAAQALHLAQPTVSMQIRQLTEQAGMPLFERVGKQIYVTQAGEVVLQGAREVFEALERMEMELAQLKGLKRGRLKVSVVTTAKYFVPRLLGPFTRDHPGIEIELDVGNRTEIVARLGRNEDDLYIMGIPPAGMEIQRHPFVDNPIVAVAPRRHPLVGRRRIPLGHFAQQPILLRERGSGTRMAVERFVKDHALKLNVRMEIGSNEAIKQAVGGGLGLSLLSLHALTAELARGELALLDVEALPIQRSWYIVHRAGKQLAIVARTFCDYLRAEGAHIARELEEAQAAQRRRALKARRAR